MSSSVALARARIGLDGRQAADDPYRPLDEMKHRVRHPVIRGRVQRERLAAGDLFALNPPLDRDPLRRERVRLGRALQYPSPAPAGSAPAACADPGRSRC